MAVHSGTVRVKGKFARLYAELTIDYVLKKAISYSCIARLSESLHVKVDDICEIFAKNNIFHLYQQAMMEYLHKNGVSHFDLIAKYNFELALLSKTFFSHPPEHYYGKTVNYLKITGHVMRNNKEHFVCDCLACGSTGYEIIRHRAINGLSKSCGCLPKGKRIPKDLPIKNETLNVELDALTNQLIQKGVLFNTESKVVNSIKNGETSAELIARKLNCNIEYVYAVARKAGYAHKVNDLHLKNKMASNKEKARKIMAAITHGNTVALCKQYGISSDTYRKYRRIIENERRSEIAA